MVGQQRRRQFGDFRLCGDLAFAQALDQRRRNNFRNDIQRAAIGKRCTDGIYPCFGAGTFGAHAGKFRRNLGKLLGRQQGVVVAEQNIGLGAELGNLGFGLAHLLAKFLNFRAQPFGCTRIGFQCRIAGRLEIKIGQRVGHIAGQPLVARPELHDDHTGLFSRINKQLFLELLENLGRDVETAVRRTCHGAVVFRR